MDTLRHICRSLGNLFDPRRVRDESSNSFALFIVMAPLIFGGFGIGLDTSRNTFIRTQLQNALDLAVVGGAGVTTISQSGNLQIKEEEALDAVDKFYALNRANGPALSCWGTNAAIEGTTLRKCWKSNERTIRNQFLYYSVQERSKNAFLPVIGVKWQEYTIEARARVNQASQ